MEISSSMLARMAEALSVKDIIQKAGGPAAIAAASDELGPTAKIEVGAIYKWPKIGIPDRHWPVIIRLSGVTADEMLAANQLARAPKFEAAE